MSFQDSKSLIWHVGTTTNGVTTQMLFANMAMTFKTGADACLNTRWSAQRYDNRLKCCQQDGIENPIENLKASNVSYSKYTRADYEERHTSILNDGT